MVRHFLVVVGTLMLAILANSQVTDKGQTYIPQTPNNASLFKYTEAPISYYNGTVNTAIPIYEVNVGSFKLPISASYHSGGVKVSEESSWVGLGWSLSTGGVISLSVIGTEDHLEEPNRVGISYMQYNISPNNPNGRDGKPINVIERGTCFPDFNGVMRNFDISQGSNAAGLGPGAYLAGSDRRYDLYLYNFGGYSGKLINPKLNFYEDKLVSLDNNNIKFIASSPIFNIPGDFKAITPDGTVYLFNEIETTITYTRLGEVKKSFSRHLTSVTTPEGRVINFSYKKIPSILLPSASHSYSTYTKHPEGGSSNPPLGLRNSKTIGSTSSLDAIYLDQITWDNGSVKFISDNNREDLNGGYRLNSIEVYNSSNLLIKKAAFSYDYFVGDIKYGDYMTQGYYEPPLSVPAANGLVAESSKKKRLKLLSVKIDDQPPYTFDYNLQTLPYKTAFSKDLWDYFNGVDLTLLTATNPEEKYSLLPNPTALGYYDRIVSPLINMLPGVPFGNRQPNELAMQAGILTKINYPTGGYSVYEYEAHKFEAPDGIMPNLSTAYVLAIDGNMPNDIKQQEFTVPAAIPGSSVNPGKINIRISCGCSSATGNSLCLPYSAAVQGSGLLTNGLYVTLERKTGNTWTVLNIWDLSYSEIVSNRGVYAINYEFIPGISYRITANYPDRAECYSDSYGNKVASIGVTYYVTGGNNTPSESIGGGLRIKTITNYLKSNIVASKKKITYENGVLMTKPNFIRIMTSPPFTFRAKNCYISGPTPCNGCDEIGDIIPMHWPGSTYPVNPAMVCGYYSEPTVPYSYGANGSLVGYGKVTEELVGQKENGQTVYEYNNTKDVVLDDKEAFYFNQVYKSTMMFDVSKMPGTPSIKNPLNGLLKSRTVYSKSFKGVNEIQKVINTYRIDNSKTYWGYKGELIQEGYNSLVSAARLFTYCNPANIDYLKCGEYTGTFLHFYPVISANVNLITKTQQVFDGAKKTETITNYVYNGKNQLHKEIVTDSKGNQIAKATYYVTDRITESPEISEMNNRNMIDYPVEVVNSDNTQLKELSKTKNIYKFFNGTSLLLPGIQKSSLSGNNNLEDEIVFHKYDSKGNVLELTSRDGVSTCYVWGYNQTYPVAKIVGATYAQVLTALSQTDENLMFLQNLSDNALEAQLNTLRNNLKNAVPLSLVSTYLYIPLVGIKYTIDPNGKKATYEYDASNRLQVIRDNDGHILQTFDYHYK